MGSETLVGWDERSGFGVTDCNGLPGLRFTDPDRMASGVGVDEGEHPTRKTRTAIDRVATSGCGRVGRNMERASSV